MAESKGMLPFTDPARNRWVRYRFVPDGRNEKMTETFERNDATLSQGRRIETADEELSLPDMDGADVQESEGAYEESELEESDWLDEDEDAGLSLDEMIAAALGSTDGQAAAPVPLEEGFRSGFVTLVGRPNAGKSTLLNAIIGKKIAITSNTAQTTRHRFRAVLTRPDFQMVIVDTPGIHKPHDVLGEELNVSALEALKDVDVVAFLVDASKPVGRGDAWVANALKGLHAKKILVLSKTDLATDEQVERQRQAADELGEWDAYVALSSKTGENVDGFVAAVAAELPEGPQWFPDDMETDQPIEVIVAEFVREKILRSFRDEIPHAIGVVVEEMEYKRKANLNTIYATVYVERDSQKGIIIGKGGAAIKMIGSEARADLEQLLGTRVFLDLRVKVKKNWRRDLNQIRRFGYGEGI